MRLTRTKPATVLVIILVMVAMGCAGPPPADDASVARSTLPDTITFAEHVAPIIWANCTPCHRPGQVGPFSLISYSDVRRKAKMVRLVTTRRYMPPWPADTSYARYLGERVLSEREIAVLAKWVELGALPGDTARLPAPPQFPEGPLAGIPDLIVTLPDTMHIPGDARDRFVIAKAPFVLERDTFVRAIIFEPGNRALVHHMNGGLVNYREGTKSDPFGGHQYIDAETSRGPEAFARLQLGNDDGTWPALAPSVVNYLPGMVPPVYPEGIGGYALKRHGTFLLNTLHYGPTSRDTTDRSRFLIYFAEGPPKRPLKELAMGSLGIAPVEPPLHLLPGEVKTFRTRYTLPEAISVLSVNPHMHLLGERFLAYAVTLAKDTIPLVRINDWDFRWQYVYTFPRMVELPKGATIHVSGTFDNTADNPDQPFDPPREVFGADSHFMRTTDEMFQFFISYVDHLPSDGSISLAPSGSAAAGATTR